MTITITPTDEIVMINDVTPARVWDGTTDAGVKVKVLVTAICVPEGADPAEFDAGLKVVKVVEREPFDPTRN